MKNKSDEVSWNEVWEQWTYLGYKYPSLNRKQECNDIIIPRENCPPGTIVQGIDWIESNDYEERIDYVVNHMMSFLLLSSLNACKSGDGDSLNGLDSG